MVNLPQEFVATKYPGYFWNVKTKTLFTAKTGVLKQMARCKKTFHQFSIDGYVVSHEGRRRPLYLVNLMMLKAKDSVFPVEFVTTKSNKNDDVAVDLSKLPPGTRVRVTIES